MLSTRPVNDVYHMHDSYELLLFLGGCTDCYIEHHRYRLKRGDLLIINSQEIHRAVASEGTPYERIATHFIPNWSGITVQNRPICSPVSKKGKMRTEICFH